MLAHHKDIGCELELGGSDSMACAQFVKGLGGPAARLRFAIDLRGILAEGAAKEVDEFDSDFDL
jgi:hypothetical protein